MCIQSLNLNQAMLSQVDSIQKQGQKITSKAGVVALCNINTNNFKRSSMHVNLWVHIPSLDSPDGKEIYMVETSVAKTGKPLRVEMGDPNKACSDKIILENVKLISSIHQVVMKQFKLSLEDVRELDYQFGVNLIPPSISEDDTSILDLSDYNSEELKLFRQYADSNPLYFHPENMAYFRTNKFKIR